MRIRFKMRTRPRVKARHRSMVVKYKGPDGKKKIKIFHDRYGNEMVKEIYYNPLAKEEEQLANLVRSIPLEKMALPLKEALSVSMIFCHDGIRLEVEEVQKVRPKGLRRGDASNFLKFVEDSLNKVVWEDDSQIVELNARFSLQSVNEEPDDTELRTVRQGNLDLGVEDKKSAKVPF